VAIEKSRRKPVAKVHWEGLSNDCLIVLYQLRDNFCLFVADQQVVILRRHVNGKEVVWQLAQAD